MNTALAVAPEASQQPLTSQRLTAIPSFTAQLDEGLTDPLMMTAEELAAVVLRGFQLFQTRVPYIQRLMIMCEDRPRNPATHRFLVPIEECFSLEEFFESKCHVSKQAIYQQMRRAAAAESKKMKAAELLAAGVKPQPVKKKQTGNNLAKETVVSRNLEKLLDAANDKIRKLKETPVSIKVGMIFTCLGSSQVRTVTDIFIEDDTENQSSITIEFENFQEEEKE